MQIARWLHQIRIKVNNELDLLSLPCTNMFFHVGGDYYDFPSDLVDGLRQTEVDWDFLKLSDDLSDEKVGLIIEDAIRTTKDMDKAFIVLGNAGLQRAHKYMFSEIEKELGRSYPGASLSTPSCHFLIWNQTFRLVHIRLTPEFWKDYFGRKNRDCSCVVCLKSECRWWDKHFCYFCSAMLCAKCNPCRDCPVCRKENAFVEMSRHPESEEEWWRFHRAKYAAEDAREKREKLKAQHRASSHNKTQSKT